MKQQLMEQQRQNALACVYQALTCLSRDDNKHARDFLVRAIALLEETKG